MFDGYYSKRMPGQSAALPRRVPMSSRIASVLATAKNLDWYDRERLERAQASAASLERRSAIKTSMFASGPRASLADHLAADTDMTAAAAIEVLRIANSSGASHAPPLSERVPSTIGTLGVADYGRGQAAGRSSFNELAAQIYESRKGKTR